RAVLSCLGTESFEVLRLVPESCLRMGIIQSHDPGPYANAQNYVKWIDVMVGVSKEISRHLATLPGYSRIETIPYGISFIEAKRTEILPDEPLRVIYLGRMAEEQKRVGRLVELVKLLEQRNENIIFTFAGQGPQLPEMRRALSGSHITKFLGEVQNHTVQNQLASQDVFVLLSDFEGLPLTLLEAMGQGVVPVVSDLKSGIRDVIDASCGICVPTGDVQAAANEISKLNRNRVQLREMSRSARTIARKNFTAGQMADKYLRLVENLAPPSVAWPKNVSIRVPLGLSPVLFSGLPRIGRRFLKKYLRGFFGNKSS
ncbi:MAG: glycosyltransferase family 4 protein, partial [Verrucomicrobiota bacterium]